MFAAFRWLVLRRFARDRTRMVLTVLGTALGVSVFVAIRLASHSALASFADTVDAVAGKANLQVSSTSDGFDERLLLRLESLPGVRAAAPVVQVSARARAGAMPLGESRELGFDEHADFDENLLVLGLDPFAEAPFARWAPPRTGDADSARAGFLRLFAQPGTVAITRTLAARHGLVEGDTLSVLASGRPVPLEIAQVLDSEELQQAAGGNVVIADLATVQETFHKAGRLDRVDLLVDPDRRAATQDAIAAVLPSDATVDLPQSRTKQVENMVSAFRLNLTALSFIALFVSMFLVFNAIAMQVLRTRREIGILRGLGATRGEVLRWHLGEGALVGVAGGALGLVLGTVFAQLALHAVGRTLSDLYLLQHTERVRPDAVTYGVGFALGVMSAIVAALAPALEAASTPAGLVMRQGQWIEAQKVPVAKLSAWGVLTLLAAAAVAAWTVAQHRPRGGFGSAFLVVAGFSLLAPAFTLACEWLGRAPVAALGGVEGRMGARYLRDALARASVVVAALVVAVGMLVALTVMVGSFRRTVDTWITQTVRGDLYIEPAGHRSTLGATVLPESLLEATRALPGVAAVDTYRGTPVRLGDRLAFVVGVEFAVQERHGSIQLVGGAPAAPALARARTGGGVLVSESFAHRHRAAFGDTITLPTPSGASRLRVEGVFYDYSTDAGAVFMDAARFAELWRDPRTESLAIYLEPGASSDSVRAAFLHLAGPGQLFHVTPNEALRRRVLTVFDQTFQITFALQAIAVLVALLGVIGTLTALILQRGREIGVLRATGATRGQVRKMVLIESGLLGAAGAVLGCLAGVVLALLLVHVINKQFFGWSIRFTLDPMVLVRSSALIVVTSVLAGLVPARLAAGRLAAEAMRSDG